jgi:DNA-binding transcriptional ArsR family regulator
VIQVDVLKALASKKRLVILEWLKDPVSNFPPQRDGDLVADGVCSLFIADKLGVSQPTASEHLRLLTTVGVLRAKKLKQWTFYQRDEERITQVKRMLQEGW